MQILLSDSEAKTILTSHFESILMPGVSVVLSGDANKMVSGMKRVVMQKVWDGRDTKINMIKYFREVSGLGLADSKIQVERIIDSNGVFSEEMADGFEIGSIDAV